ncbi:hypothetical protein [Sanguibacter massiliensis]|uniref:hypothetical protein n=1 Tax=Sanguibacter massiliensis TaxID=1973217 RepID=UPI000C8344C0|nr:hypothetical protein [Sanguibacter massiliensis]
MNSIRDALPAPARKWVYLGLIAALAVATVMEGGFTVETIIKIGGMLGLGLAAGNVTPAPEGEDVG